MKADLFPRTHTVCGVCGVTFNPPSAGPYCPECRAAEVAKRAAANEKRWAGEAVGPWKCGATGLEWEGDISKHHGIPPGEGFCPGPHLPAEAAKAEEAAK